MTFENCFNGDNSKYQLLIVELHVHPNPQLPQTPKNNKFSIKSLEELLKPIWWIVQNFIWIIPLSAEFISYFFRLIL